MRLLVLGGTRFVGRAMVEMGVARGYEVTTFNRGLSGKDLSAVVAVHGDREDAGDLDRLAAGRQWDAVIDTSGFVPRVVGAAARALSGEASRYVFVSTVSVYSGWPVEPLSEASPMLACPADAGPDFGADDRRGAPRSTGSSRPAASGPSPRSGRVTRR